MPLLPPQLVLAGVGEDGVLDQGGGVQDRVGGVLDQVGGQRPQEELAPEADPECSG